MHAKRAAALADLTTVVAAPFGTSPGMLAPPPPVAIAMLEVPVTVIFLGKLVL